MRVLIGCEESGVVRDAFIKAGHDAVSCDLQPTRSKAPGRHLMYDIKEAIRSDIWDVIILHPDCTALSLSGNRWYGKGMPRNDERINAINWTIDLWSLAKQSSLVGCALENPTSVIWQYIGQPQYIHPHQFGHGEVKKTGIITHRLPPLQPTNIVEGREAKIWKMPPSPTRKRDRAVTYQGIADAMAEQWGKEATISKEKAI